MTKAAIASKSEIWRGFATNQRRLIKECAPVKLGRASGFVERRLIN